MALDATIGGASSDTYGSLAEADAYFLARDGAWAGTNTDKESALRKAATFLDNEYRGKWKGVRINQTQALAWPRAGVSDADGFPVSVLAIPTQIKNAQFEAAKLIAAGTQLEATIERAVKSEKVGSLAVVYSDGASVQAQYPQITGWLSDLVIGGSSRNGSFGTSAVVRG